MLIHFLTEFFVEDSLMRGVLVDDEQLVVALHKQISCKKLPDDDGRCADRLCARYRRL